MRWIRMFEDGSAEERDLLGGKGANLAEMTRLGLPVPPGFVITTEACRAYLAEGGLPTGLLDELREALDRVELATRRRFGDPSDPLLVSVRSGAKFSMPGMMDTVLNVGLNAETLKGLIAGSGDERFGQDAYRRLVDLFGRVVLDVPAEAFEDVRREVLTAHGAGDPADLDAAGAAELAARYEQVVERETGAAFPADPEVQLRTAVEAVFRSWNGRRARDYRRHESIPEDLGTAVNVQAMVFGNAGLDSGTGVAFTRDPATGEARPYGDFLRNAQGEDVVAGVRNTSPLSELADVFPACHTELLAALGRLEGHYGDMCDVEFTIERGTLYILQTRVGKRSSAAALRMAVEMVAEGLIDRATAVSRFAPAQLERLLHPRFDPSATYEVLATGLGASPGAAAGRVAFTADDAEARAAAGERVILVRRETSPDGLHGILAAQGVLTGRGGLVSHAAVVARGIGKPAVCGAAELDIDLHARTFAVGGTVVRDGDTIAIDGTTGEIVLGDVAVVTPEPPAELDRLLGWADGLRTLGIRANADTAADVRVARAQGAEGVGLCRTEHQFLGDRLPVIQRVILAETPEEERAALDELHGVQLEDFIALLEAADGQPVTVRLLDPPLHEFLPDLEELVVAEALDELDPATERLLRAVRAWSEDNPMLGIRGVRLGILRPALYAMQVRALVEAAVVRHRAGGDPIVAIMVPLVAEPAELRVALADVRRVADEVLAAAGVGLDYRVGVMIETPRAALLAGQLAELCDFFSFGTNDLTQLTFGFSRDDVEGRLMPRYLERGILAGDPFEHIDVAGVGSLVRTAVELGRAVDPHLELGVCGEHGGDPASIAFFADVGLDDVSCSPFRVRVARLAAAHAALRTAATERDR